MALSSIFNASSGGAPTLNFNAANGYMSGQQGIEQNIGVQQGQTQAQSNLFNANNLAALNQYSNYLNQNPGTNAQDAAYVATAEKGQSEAAANAGANLSLEAAQRGIAPNSSLVAGGLATINSNLASTDSQTRANLANAQVAQHAQNMGTLANLWGGAANNAFNQNNALQTEQSGILGNLTNDATQQALDQYNAQYANYQNQQKSMDAGLGAIGDAAAAYFAPGSAAAGILGG